MSDRPCCAHMRVVYGPECTSEGNRDRWACSDCGCIFMPAHWKEIFDASLATVTRERDEMRNELDGANEAIRNLKQIADEHQSDASIAAFERDEMRKLAIYAVRHAAELCLIMNGPIVVQSGLEIDSDDDAGLLTALKAAFAEAKQL